MDPRLAEVVEQLGPDRWAAVVIDADFRLVWMSDEWRAFLGVRDDAEAGIGRPVVAAMFQPAWMRSVTPDGQIALFQETMPYLLGDQTLDQIAGQVPEPFRDLLLRLKPRPAPVVWTGRFDYVPGDLTPYPVEYVVIRLREADGATLGLLLLSNIGMRPTLMSRLTRGDTGMYERMARLTEPARHATAILFADLEGSATLSRRLPTASYFAVIRALTSGFDDLVAEAHGIVGKHAGDGWTGFFLADDTGGPSSAAAAAIRVARGMQTRAVHAGSAVQAPLEGPLLMNVGLHWGAGVYLGQLVPGGRLEVTALGDEVNECARIQQSARGGRLVASKQLVELLDGGTAAALGIATESLAYEPLGSLSTATDKARRDAGLVPVTTLPG